MTAPQPSTPTDDPVQRTVAVYSRIAAAYAETWFHDPIMEPMLNRFCELLPEPMEVLDAGCGPGRDSLALAHRGVEVVGADLSEPMLEEARRRVPQIVFRRLDFRCLPYPPESFAGVWTCGALHHLPGDGMARAVGEFVRVLRPGGVLAATVPSGREEGYDNLGRYYRKCEPEEFRRLVERAGLRVVEAWFSTSDKQTLPASPCSRTWLNLLAIKDPQPLDSQAPADVEGCLFCSGNRFSFNRQVGLPGSSSILWGDARFAVFPDVAPMLAGHLLLVPVSHYLCYGALPRELEPPLHAVKRAVRELFWDAYREPAVFLEHGPSHPGDAGACVDHAHLHCIPAALPVRAAVERLLHVGPLPAGQTPQGLHQAGRSYLSVEDVPGETTVYPVEALPSQFFRQVLAVLLGGGAWRWQTLCRNPATRAAYRHTLEQLMPLVDRRPFAARAELESGPW